MNSFWFGSEGLYPLSRLYCFVPNKESSVHFLISDLTGSEKDLPNSHKISASDSPFLERKADFIAICVAIWEM